MEHSERFPVRLLDRRSYIDTVILVVLGHFPQDEYVALRAAAEGRLFPRQKRFEGGRFSQFLVLQQPTQTSLEWLRDYEARSPGFGPAGKSLIIVRVDVALDLIVGSASAAALGTRYVQSRLLPFGRHRDPWKFDAGEERTLRRKSVIPNDPEPGEGSRSKEFRLGILGYGMKSGGVRTAVYGDLMSKTNAYDYCVHIECRVLRKRALEALAMREFGELLELEHRVFWTSVLRLAEPPSQKVLARVIERRRAKATRYPVVAEELRSQDRSGYSPERLAHTILRGHRDKDGQTISHDLLLGMRAAKSIFGALPQRHFTPISTARLLPVSSKNALWAERWP